MSFTYQVKVSTRFNSDAFEIIADKTFTGLTQKYETEEEVSSATVVLWDSDAEGAIGDFTVLQIETEDAEVDIELTTQDGDANEKPYVIRLTPDLPLLIGDDTSFYNYTGDGFAGTLGTIDRIRAKEQNGNTATVKLTLLK